MDLRGRSNRTIPLGESRPVVIVLGDFTHEGLAAKIESLGFEVINRRLRSTPANWQRITDLMRSLIGDGRLALLFAYIPTTSLMLMAEPSYDHVRPGLLAEIERTRAIFFVHEDNLQGRLEPLPWEVEDTDDATRERMDIPWRTIDVSPFRQTREDWIEAYAAEIARSLALIEQLAQRKIEPVPFRKRSDVTLRMFEALEEAQAGIFLRLYVPHGRYQSEQFEDFLTLFARYLTDRSNGSRPSPRNGRRRAVRGCIRRRQVRSVHSASSYRDATRVRTPSPFAQPVT